MAAKRWSTKTVSRPRRPRTAISVVDEWWRDVTGLHRKRWRYGRRKGMRAAARDYHYGRLLPSWIWPSGRGKRR